MADIADNAQSFEERERAQVIASHDARPREAQNIVNGVPVCRWCGQEIDHGRLQANPNAVRCTECQDKHDRNQKR